MPDDPTNDLPFDVIELDFRKAGTPPPEEALWQRIHEAAARNGWIIPAIYTRITPRAPA